MHFGPWTKLLGYSKLHIWHLTDLCHLNNFIWKNRANFSHSETHFPLFVATCTTCFISMSHVLIWILVNDSFLFDAFILHLMFWKHTFHGTCVQRFSSVLFVLRMQPKLKMAYSWRLKKWRSWNVTWKSQSVDCQVGLCRISNRKQFEDIYLKSSFCD